MLKIKIDTNGTITHIYTDQLSLSALGKQVIERASHVEPDADNRWSADMGISEGPVLGPFKKRSEALEAEVKWLEENIF